VSNPTSAEFYQVTIDGTLYAVREVIDENGFINFYDLKNRPSFLTDENAMIGFGALGGVLGALLLGQGLSAFGKGLADFFSSLFGEGGGGEGGGGEPEPDPEPNVFEDRILDLIRKHLNPNIASCVNELDYLSMKEVAYTGSTQKKLFVNWNDNIFGNPIAKPCDANHVGLLRSLVMSTSAKLYTTPDDNFRVDDITQITSLSNITPTNPFIDFGTRAVSLTSIPTSFTAPETAKMGTVKGYDFEADKEGVILRYPTAAQRAAYDDEQRFSLRNVMAYRKTQAATNASVLTVRDPLNNTSYDVRIPVIDYKGQYLGDIRPAQIVTSEALDERSWRDGTIRLNRDEQPSNRPLWNSAGTAPELVSAQEYNNRIAQNLGPALEQWVIENPLFQEERGPPMVTPVREPITNSTAVARDADGNFTPEYQRRINAWRLRNQTNRAYQALRDVSDLTSPIPARGRPARPPPPIPVRPNNGFTLEAALGRIEEGNFIAYF
jgi:hypothetical protein